MKIIIIGSGASGLAAGISLLRCGYDVTILERNNISGKKLLLTGAGRCNFFNSDQNIVHYHSNDKDILAKIITSDNIHLVEDFITSLGIVPKVKDGYYYPFANQAYNMKELLERTYLDLGGKIKYNYLVEKIEKKNSLFLVNDNISCDKLILATGSKAYKMTGSDGIGYQLAKKFNHHIVKVLPSLTSLITREKINLKGVRVDAKVTLYEDGVKVREELGQVQFTDYGLSGICIFNLSYYAVKGLNKNKKEVITIDLMPFMDKVSFKNKKVYDLLLGFLPNKMIDYILKTLDISKDVYYEDLSNDKKQELTKILKEMEFNITSYKEFDFSQVCSGGVSLREINPLTMESIFVKNLYIIGELLDVNGDCGGYNLTFAFLSGILTSRGDSNA
ncbi:MAG: aminoacetone oxidase family FAD-binding enzyme [Clostridium sp.]|nr:aminoacetone oxidase family FAD-binding enzyme [Clostridium sp.]